MTRKAGLWLIGAQGGVSTTVAVGLVALQKKLTEPFGLVSNLPVFSDLELLEWPEIVIGGHEIRKTSLIDEARQLANVSRAIDSKMVDQCEPELARYDRAVRPGVLSNVGRSIENLASDGFVTPVKNAAEAVDQISNDYRAFVDSNELDSCVIINLASTEPPVDPDQFPADWASLEASLNRPDCELPASSLYAIAALKSGFPFINFTPSLGSCLPAIDQLATTVGTCHMGHDGKTGETFLKSVLAPAFAQRNLDIMSWVGHNIFGNMDGQILDDPANKATKVASKDRLLGEILGYDPQTHISIEYIKSLGDWKTAWDHIHFRGFMGTPMVLQFTWQGCDSILAAPLVLDLMRLTDLARRRNETGLLTAFASFFKSPLGTKENDFAKQFQMLVEWAKG